MTMVGCQRGFMGQRWRKWLNDAVKGPSYVASKWNLSAGSSIWLAAPRFLRIVVNGSFITDLAEPNDVDCVLLVGSDFPPADPDHQELLAELPFISMQIVDQAGFDFFVNEFFATDRHTNPK